MSLSDEFKKRQAIPSKLTSTATVASGPANLFGILISHDGANNPTVSVYNATSAQAAQLLFSRTYW